MVNKTERPHKQNSKAGLGWLFKMAWRDGKASKKKLVLFMASIILGIAAVVSIQSFGVNLKDNIGLKSKALMGADYKIEIDELPNEKTQQIIDSLGGADSREIKFVSMGAFNSTEATRLVEVRGIESGFPFYGALETRPATAAQNFREKEGALVDATLMLQLGIETGDSIKIGKLQLPVIGKLGAVPGGATLFSSIAPPVLIPYPSIKETGLIQTGSRIGYKYYFKDANTDLERLDRELKPVLDLENADLRTHTSTSERLGKRYQNFGKFLNLVAFIALLLGCVGIASAINIYIKEKLKAIAVLKCLGASKKQTFLIYLIQVAIMGLIGGFLGTALGLVLQQIFPWLLEGLLPVDVQLTISWQVILMGISLGVFMSLLFALYPLIGTLYIFPLQALRVQLKENIKSRKAIFLVSLAIFLFIFLFSLWLLKNWKYSLAFVGGILITFAILAGIAKLFMQLIKRFFPKNWGFLARQSLLNLFRPQNQTITLILAIGVGTFLISTLYFSKDLLLAQTSVESQANSPNMILLDVQTEQKQAVAETVKKSNLPVLNNIPIVTMRVHSINGKTNMEIKKDSSSQINNWILDHEFRVTYRDSLSPSESLVSGDFIAEAKDADPVPISISDNFARDAKVALGDKVVFNIQGLLKNTVVKSIRQVDWSQMQINFSLVFPKGILEKAPQFHVITTKVPNEIASAKLQQNLVKEFPNVSIIDLRQVLSVIEKLLDKISWIINFMAFFSILTGIIVLLGAIKISKFQRIRENVLLRTLGAKNNQIFKIVALEYLYLGILGALSGILLSLISSQLLAALVFETAFTPSLFPFLVVLPGVTLLVLIIGLSNSLEIIRKPPLEILRKEV